MLAELPGFSFVLRLAESPDKLRPELDLPRRCDRRRLQHRIAWNVCPPAVDDGRHPGAEVSPVEQIESLSPELNLHFLAPQIVVLEQRKIEVFQSRRAQCIAAEIT